MMSARSPVVQHLTKSEFAYRELRRRILENEIAPGTRLLLRPLAEELGLSVMPVRDALRMLEGDGLVTLESHRGATVTQISRESVLQIISMRMWMEVLAVVEAAPRHTPASLARVEKIHAEAEKAMRSGGSDYTRANRRLHEAIEAPAPELVRQLIRELWERLWQTRRRSALFETLPDRIPAAQAEHAAIVEALVAGDADAAGLAMERHRLSTLVAWERALPPAGEGSDDGEAAVDR
jgi:DNA-binding GntR family transcriptional regulator